jgi:hypothetical protein
MSIERDQKRTDDRAQKRVWVRRDYPRQSFFWRALLLLFVFLLLIAYSLFRFAPNRIQESAPEATVTQLRLRILDGSIVSVANQRVIRSDRQQNVAARELTRVRMSHKQGHFSLHRGAS